jgi:hypothetical protein
MNQFLEQARYICGDSVLALAAEFVDRLLGLASAGQHLFFVNLVLKQQTPARAYRTYEKTTQACKSVFW